MFIRRISLFSAALLISSAPALAQDAPIGEVDLHSAGMDQGCGALRR